MKNKKGITLVSLAILIVVMFIIVGITVTYGGNLIQKSRISDYIEYMKLVKARADVVLEDEYFLNNIESTEHLYDNEIAQIASMINPKYTISENIIKQWGRNFKIIKWYQDDIAKQGIDKSILGEEQYFAIIFDEKERVTKDVIYSQGCKLRDYVYYSLLQMQEVIAGN